MKPRLLQKPGVSQRASEHAARRHAALLGQNLLFHAAGIDADADGHMVHFGAVCHTPHLTHAADVAGVDAHLGDAALHGSHGQVGPVVDIRHKRHGRPFDDGGQRLQALLVVHAQAHDVASGLGQGAHLGKGGCGIAGIGVGHALHGDGRAAADGKRADEKGAGVAHGDIPPQYLGYRVWVRLHYIMPAWARGSTACPGGEKTKNLAKNLIDTALQNRYHGNRNKRRLSAGRRSM